MGLSVFVCIFNRFKKWVNSCWSGMHIMHCIKPKLEVSHPPPPFGNRISTVCVLCSLDWICVCICLNLYDSKCRPIQLGWLSMHAMCNMQYALHKARILGSATHRPRFGNRISTVCTNIAPVPSGNKPILLQKKIQIWAKNATANNWEFRTSSMS